MEKLAIVIFTCEKYSDLWESYFSLFNKFLQKKNEKVYLITDKESNKKIDNVKIISCGENCSFPKKLEAVSKINAEYFLFTLDDYFIKESIDIKTIYDCIELLDRNNGVYFRFFKRSISKLKFQDDKYLRTLNPNHIYMVNLYTGLWKKELIDDILMNVPKTLNIWQFESNIHAFISPKMKEKYFIGSNKQLYPFVDIIRKGKVLRSATSFLKSNNIILEKRKIMTRRETLKLNLKTIIARKTPRIIKKRFKKLARKNGAKFYTDL